VSGPLARLPLLRTVRSGRSSSWDRSGGNRDFVVVEPGGTTSILDLAQPGTVRHIWVTTGCDDQHYLRKVILRGWWDDQASPCFEVPLGDFFGLGHAQTRNYWSLPLQMSPEDGRGFNCWFPMPFRSARMSVENESRLPLTLYYYVDYELSEAPADVEEIARSGRFHAQWRRQNPTDGVAEGVMTNAELLSGGVNLSGEGNYVILEAEGQGHYVGCNLSIANLRQVGTEVFNWYGEGDDMIFVDGEPFPPSLHGTGTEDYFNTAYSPSEAYSSPYHGIILPGGRNWAGLIALYRYHIEDPVRFQRSIRVTIEHGHANRRSDDFSSTAYWYQAEPHSAFPPLPLVGDRLPNAGIDVVSS
jgi:D-arabinan exo alpha-(1,3)/(1,5)-arabinofuranosidase (non-reducing end)